jgi:hypothetical protein
MEERPFTGRDKPFSLSVIPSDSQGASATEEESRNPENVHRSTPFQGVLTGMDELTACGEFSFGHDL